MANQPKPSLFIASREAAQKIMDDRPNVILRYETSDDARIREQIKRTTHFDDNMIDIIRDHYHIFNKAKHQLGL